MTWTFLLHLYKSFTRSSSVGKDAAVQIILGFVVIALVGYSLALGFALEKIIINALKHQDAIAFLNQLLIYYFIGGFITRYFVQSLPALDVQPYLHLPIPRSRISNFLLCKSLIHPINISVFLLFTPFAFGAVARVHGTEHAWVWLLSLWFLSLINHFMVILVKGNLAQSAWKLSAFIVSCAFVACADYLGWLKLSLVSANLFAATLQGPAIAGILLLAIIMLYYAIYRMFINRLYPEEFTMKDNNAFHSANWAFLQNFGLMGSWIKVELKLIFRNKRSRELFLMHVVFLLLPLGFYSYTKNQDSYGSFLFFAMISSGFFTMNYGQFLFSWQGDHFDFTLTQPTSIRQFVESKYWLLVSTTAIWFLLSIPYLFLGWKFFFVNLVACFYNIGINTLVVMNTSMWGAKRINLRHPGSINMEGMGAAQWVLGFPLMAIPFLFYIPLSLTDYPLFGLVLVGMVGMLGFVFRQRLIDFTSRRFSRMRHSMASNFRKD